MADLLPHQQRVVDEMKELDHKIEKLQAFTVSDTFANLQLQERIDLREQLYFMEQYSSVLARRINRF